MPVGTQVGFPKAIPTYDVLPATSRSGIRQGEDGAGAARPRITCSPSGTSGVVASAATAPEISTERPPQPLQPAGWLTSLRFVASLLGA